jgi:hypothetical protein
VADDNQPPLPGLDYIGRAAAISKRASKERQRKRLPVIQPELIGDRGFDPKTGVPRTRGECPTERPCPFVRCRWHLFMEDAEHRAGRPGLASVKRDSKGLTTSQLGDAGTDRPGTTLRPGWLKYRGLEIEREVVVYVTRVDSGYEIHEVRNGTLDHWLSRIRIGEPFTVWEKIEPADGPGIGVFLAHAQREQRGLVFDRELPEDRLQSSDCIVFVRTRAVSSCALDEIDRHGRLTNEDTGNAVARHRTLVAREVNRALGKAIRAAGEMGMSEADLLRGLRELGAGQ